LLGLLVVSGSTIRDVLEGLVVLHQIMIILLESAPSPSPVQALEVKLFWRAAYKAVTMTGKSLLFSARKNLGGADELRARDLVDIDAGVDGVRR
jgi:hypothetical protein